MAILRDTYSYSTFPSSDWDWDWDWDWTQHIWVLDLTGAGDGVKIQFLIIFNTQSNLIPFSLCEVRVRS